MKPIYFKDLIQGKTYEELMELLPCMVCKETKYAGAIFRTSYTVLGFGKGSVILGYTGEGYDEDAFFGDGRYEIAEYCEIEFKDLTKEYIYAHKPTEKQIAFLESIGEYNRDMSGYEAWHIIHDKIEDRKRKKAEHLNRKDYDDYDDDEDYYDEYYDIPNC